MKHLLLDTSTERGFVAIAESDRLIESLELPFGLQNSKYLLPSLLELLKKYKISIQNLDLISCGVGPGSYTGIRVGAALAQAIAYAQKIPLVQFSSLMGFTPNDPLPYAAVIDAKIGGVYVLFGPTPFEDQPRLVPNHQIPEVFEKVELIVCPEKSVLQAKILSPKIKWQESFPSASFLSQMCFSRYKRGLFSEDAKLDLIYLRDGI